MFVREPDCWFSNIVCLKTKYWQPGKASQWQAAVQLLKDMDAPWLPWRDFLGSPSHTESVDMMLS